MAWDLLIRGGNVVTHRGVSRVDVAVENGEFVEFRPELSGAARETIDARGLHVFPGAIDPHVHFNEPGRTEWEGFATGSSALAAGGGTCFFDMPLNSTPATLDGERFDEKRGAAEASSLADFGLWGGLTPSNVERLEELADRGVVGFKAFMSDSGIEEFGRADDLTLYRGMQIARRLGLLVAVHAESEEITSRLAGEARAGGRRGWRDYLNSRPVIAETEAIQRAILLAEETQCPLHIVHVSSPRGVQLVTRAAAQGVNVTCETCAHYLAFSEVDLEERGSALKCAPPLRPSALRDRLWAELADGNIQFVTSDHSPAPATMKSSDDAFAIWGGIAGVQSTRAVLLSHEPVLAPETVAKLTADHVAQRFVTAGKGRIVVGYDADLALVDIRASYALTRDMLLDRHKLSPYVGRTFHGVVKRTIVRGHTVFRDGKIVAGDFRGRLVKPERARKAGVS